MIEHAEQDPGIAGKEELASANDVMLAIVRTSKGLRMYLPNNPVLISFVEELNAKMAAHLERFGQFRLDVEPFALRYKGCDIYQSHDPKESIACRIHADGIRGLLFDHGMESRELMTLLGIVGFERPTSDDDIVTQLWERNLPHITYLLEEDFLEAQLEEEPSAGGGQQEAITSIYQSLAEQPPPAPRMIPKHLLMLSAEEVKWLRKVRQVEARHNALDDVINILSAILAGVKDQELFKDFVDIMANLTANMFLAGELQHALRLVRFMDQLLKIGSSTAPYQRQLLAEALTGILSDATLHVLQEALDSTESISHEELKELLHIFGLPSLGAICELLGRVEKLKMRKVIIEALVELGRENPAVFAPFLSDPRWYLVRNVVLVLSLLGSPVALDMIIALISHREPRIRREVLGFLERSSDMKAKSYIVKFLRDDSSALRIKALQLLARERHTFALKPILALTGAEDFSGKEFAEKKAIYEALGEIGSDGMIPVFRDMLLKRHWFQKAAAKETATLAVAGLMKMHSGAALRLLEEARSQKRAVEVMALLDRAVSAMTAAKERAAG